MLEDILHEGHVASTESVLNLNGSFLTITLFPCPWLLIIIGVTFVLFCCGGAYTWPGYGCWGGTYPWFCPGYVGWAGW